MIRRAIVLVLGDVGRSPRMLYHARSLSGRNIEVDFVGYEGSKPNDDLLNNKLIRFIYLWKIPRIPESWPKIVFLLFAPFKLFFQFLSLYWILLVQLRKADVIFVQNPPAIPTLLVVYLYCRITATKFVLDWHNLAFTILALRLGTDHSIVRFASFYERILGNFADIHICVSNAMMKHLVTEWKFSTDKVVVLYDRPPNTFKPLSTKEKKDFCQRIDFLRLPFTTSVNKPAFLVTSTSWTEDEDLGLFFDALIELDKEIEANPAYPDFFVVVTGKGPLKPYFETKLQEYCLKRIFIKTAWLKIEDYPLLLGCADMGICLHYSSSGLDLPMKIVDMFGCGLPVCAIDFKCLHELVTDGENGLVFQTKDELKKQLLMIFKTFPRSEVLDKMKVSALEVFKKNEWEASWSKLFSAINQNICL